MNVKDEFFKRDSLVVGNVRYTRFWEDTWLGDTPLKDQYLTLYNIINFTNVTIANAMASTPLNIGFRIVLSVNKWDI
jgi:hypothetical protein